MGNKQQVGEFWSTLDGEIYVVVGVDVGTANRTNIVFMDFTENSFFGGLYDISHYILDEDILIGKRRLLSILYGLD